MGLASRPESEENLCVYSFHNFRIIIVILSAGIIRPKCVSIVVVVIIVAPDGFTLRQTL